MSGRLYVVHGDLALLACDVAIVPTDALLRVEESWHGLVTSEEARTGAPTDRDGRSFALPARDGGPQRVLLEVATEGSEPVEWYVDGVREALDLAATLVAAPGAGEHRRTRRPLVALPLVGTGLGGSAGRRGDLIPPMLDLLEDAAAERDLDLALVTYDRPDYAAVQSVRALRAGLPGDLEEHVRRLAELADRGNLVPFLGAGVSAAVGLPAWWDLLERVADAGGLLHEMALQEGGGDAQRELRESLRRLGTLDAAELLRTVLGTEAINAIVRELDADRHALAHGLLASLGCRRVITTNYDRLYELAALRPAAVVGGLAVLPWDAADPDRPWLVKMHGDVGHPDSIVLSRGDIVGYDQTRRPLASLLQAQMLTGHLLFVGSSMTDDAVVSLAWEIRELFRAWHAPVRVVGTVLGLWPEPLRARLWQDVLVFVPLSTGVGEEEAGETLLPAFLDRLAQLAATDRSFLLDDRYAGMVPKPLRPLTSALRRVVDAVEGLPVEVDPALVRQVEAGLSGLGWRGERGEREE